MQVQYGEIVFKVFTQAHCLWRMLCAVFAWLSCRWRPPIPKRSHPGWRTQPASILRRRRPKPAWVEPEVIRLKAHMPQAGCRRIAHTFNRLHAQRGTRIGKSHVATLVCRNRYAIDVMRRRIKHRVPAPMPCNRAWAMDFTGKGDKAHHAHQILGLIDHGSRLLLDLARVPNKRSYTLLGHLFLAMGKYGKPLALRTDNEAVFRCRRFRLILKLIGIRQQFTELGCSWQNGRIERIFGTLKQSLDQIQIDTGEALDGLLDQFRFHYNHVRPHQHLHGDAGGGLGGRGLAEASVQIRALRKPMGRHADGILLAQVKIKR
ncbi:MAG: Integrase core domain protein [Rhodocyclales bacterium]|nr:Integrase core domain protein [Rhodocyclales bacterium]